MAFKSLRKSSFMLLLAALCCALPTHAVESKSTFTYTYSGRLDSEEKADAILQAKVKAIETWIATSQPYQERNFSLAKDDITENIDEYLLSSAVVSKDNNKDIKQYRVVVRVDINDTKLLNYLTAVGRAKDVSMDDEDQYITFVFVARELASRTEAKDTASGDFKRAKTLWQATTTSEIDIAVGEVFADANYYVIEAALLEEDTAGQLDVNNFLMDYEQGDDLTPGTKRDAIRGLKSLEDPVQYLAIGTLDVDEHVTDDVTGLYKVPVSVTAKILSVKRRGATMASIGPVQYLGLGPTPIVAKNNALKLAAQEMAAGLIGQLSSKSI